MLTISVNNTNKIINNLIISEDHSSDRAFYNKKLLNLASNNVINSITDAEVVEYKPERAQVINFNLFFLKYFQNEDYNNILPYIESKFVDHFKTTKIEFGLLNADGTTPDVAYNSYLDIRQDNLLRAPAQDKDINVLNKNTLINSGLAVFNEGNQSNLKKPVKAGIPIFYNSFTIPYWEKNDDWKDNSLLYKNKPYFYNSLLLMEVYDSPDNLKQNRLITIPVFVNQRYNLNEKPANYDTLVERPCFQLTNGCDGFSLFFLNKSIYSDLYVKFSFWDALSGRKIPLIPSSKTETNKKWFQKSNSFKQESIYLKYTLDYTRKTYNITEFDYTTNKYELIRTDFDLYEFAFDQYFEDFNVINIKPIDSSAVQPTPSPLNPFKFTINNVIRDIYYNVNGSNINTNIFNLSYNDNDTFLNSTGGLVRKYNDYVNIMYSKNITFFCFKQNTITLPVINKTYQGYSNNILDFKIRNIDTSSWKISSVDFIDIVLGLDNSVISGSTATNTIYKDQVLCEALTIIDNSVLDSEINSFVKPPDTINIETPNNVWALSKNLFFEIDIFEFIITASASFSDSAYHNNVRYEPLLINLMNILEYQPNPVDTSHDIVSFLIKKYDHIKKNDISKYREIINELTQILELDVKDIYRSKVLKYVNDYFTTNNYPRYITSYLNLIYKNNNNFNFADAKILSLLSPDVVKLKANEGFTLLDGFFETYKDLAFNFRDGVDYYGTKDNLKVFDVRDYVFDTILTVSEYKNILPNSEVYLSLKYNIGYKILQAMLNTKKITIKGKIKIGVENSDKTKNIFIPINVTLNIGDKPVQSYLSEVTSTAQQLNI
jgi:hypothetical protein